MTGCVCRCCSREVERTPSCTVHMVASQRHNLLHNHVHFTRHKVLASSDYLYNLPISPANTPSLSLHLHSTKISKHRRAPQIPWNTVLQLSAFSFIGGRTPCECCALCNRAYVSPSPTVAASIPSKTPFCQLIKIKFLGMNASIYRMIPETADFIFIVV